MRIEIPNYDEVLVIDNEELNNDHLVNISIERGEETIIAAEAVSLNELIAALEMFRQLRLLNKEAFPQDVDTPKDGSHTLRGSHNK